MNICNRYSLAVEVICLCTSCQELNKMFVLTCMYCHLPMIAPLTRIRISRSSSRIRRRRSSSKIEKTDGVQTTSDHKKQSQFRFE
jgi:hypothetical protein